jgi:UDP:flavonoid glycosyltransferase YjiC (YdhE family)
LKRILFAAESITLAQVVRLASLANSLDPERYDVHFACGRFDPLIFSESSFTQWPILTRDADRVLRRERAGRRLYTHRWLSRYVDAERRLIEEVRPDLVVGDFRLSLGISAPLAKIPYAALINAYWSPAYRPERFPMPDHFSLRWLVRLAGPDWAQRNFEKLLPKVLSRHAGPFNLLRKKHGLPPVGDLRDVLTCGDHVLFPDVPELVPLADLPANHVYLGPVNWAPDSPPPACWDSLQDDRPIVYVTMGSSGRIEMLKLIAAALHPLEVQVLLATAGRRFPAIDDPRWFSADYLPGHLSARRAALVICNGGASTAYQALSEGTPVIGIPGNLDQLLAMQAIEKAGAGLLVRAPGLSAGRLRQNIESALESPALADGARRVADWFARYDANRRFGAFLEETLAA